MAAIPCGTASRVHFGFDPKYRHLNHGSFGTYPRAVRDEQRRHQDRSLSRPDPYLIYEYPQILEEARRLIADYVHAPPTTCVFVPNATTGVNTVLRNLIFAEGDIVIYFTNIYAACAKTIAYLEETTPVTSHCVELTYPIADADVCIALETAILQLQQDGKTPRVVIFDTISSSPGVRMPFERLTAICRQYSVLSLIDGAHGIGQIPLNLSELDPDFFVSNCHKWLYTPRGCALFYVPLRNQHLIRSPLPTSHGFQSQSYQEPEKPWWDQDDNQQLAKSYFTENFAFVGATDMSPYACVAAALEWRSRITFNGLQGEPAIYSYLQTLARRGGEIICTAVPGSLLLENDERTLGRCAFAVIRLPLEYAQVADGEFGTACRIWAWMKEVCTIDYDTHLQWSFYQGAWWVRLSAQVYLEEADLVWAASIINEVCRRVVAGEWKTAIVKKIL